ncbi:flagellar biosynthesis regulator FlaF [Tianweitania sp. BSSL-BM11]|uniref:Flagellar biosynthesis regulator FlaF n=1 Tax=Tianweitania aestuarii TaxID=2814886 RepID=A0ABS5RWC6_9HYPH|nr:flagellar biosynthesis regulator FlaF [Tianweitania aestuarii]MBS9721324.1 flagellar biosynthesis regulator FlaF [Tianweitania aestuarii]
MYQFSYAEIQADTIADARDRERQLLVRSIELLGDARAAGPRSRQAVEAALFMHRIWTSFVSDLQAPENSTPKDLRDHLIAVGSWLLAEAETLRLGRSADINGLIDVSTTVLDGLE